MNNEEALVYEENDVIDLRDLFAFLLSKIWIIILVSILAGAIGFAYSSLVMPLKFESYTTMYVKNVNQNGVARDENLNLNDINASKSLVNTYIAVLNSNAVMDEIGEELLKLYKEEDLAYVFPIKDGKVSTSALKKSFAMSAVNDTEVMKISCTTLNPEVSAYMCNIMADIAPGFLIRIVGAGSVEVIDVAKANNDPVSPDIKKNTAIALAAGFVLACGVLFLMFMLDNTVKDSDVIAKKYNKAFLGEVQNVGDEKKKKRKGSHNSARTLLTDSSVPFGVVESYKSIRSNVLFTLSTSDNNVIAVSSPNPGEGKSTTAANLAVAFAQTGAKVLLIDADMRKPVQHKTFDVKNKDGLSTLIIKRSEAADSIKKNVVKGLDVLPAGPIPPNPSELLASEKFASIIEDLSKQYDYVVMDTPPINVVSDAMVIKDCIGGILMVLKYAVTTEEEVADCMKQIEIAGANVLGFVLNDITAHYGKSYYNYKYKYKKYGYYGAYGYYGNSDKKDKDDSDDENMTNISSALTN